jgi:hypothetical protein
MFSIAFQRAVDADEPNTACGLLTLGSYSESFVSSLSFWSQAEYERHWAEAAGRIMAGAGSSALVTDMYDPANGNFIRWWPFYRRREKLRFHNQVLLIAELDKPFDVRDLFDAVPPYTSLNEDGQPISEWSLPPEDVEAWLEDVNAR